MGLGPEAAQGPRGTPLCPSSSATHLTYMEGFRQVVPDAGETLLQVQELAINFELTGATAVLMGLEPASALSSEVTSIEKSFARSVHVEGVAELEALLPTLPGPAFFVLGSWRAERCAPSPTLARLRAIFKPGAWAHAAGSVLLLPRANQFFGVGSPECAALVTRCEPTALEVQAALCALAPGMNQGMWRGTLRVYPAVEAPWRVRVPVPIPPANLWSKFTLEKCVPGEACEGEARGVGIGMFYIQVRGNGVFFFLFGRGGAPRHLQDSSLPLSPAQPARVLTCPQALMALRVWLAQSVSSSSPEGAAARPLGSLKRAPPRAGPSEEPLPSSWPAGRGTPNSSPFHLQWLRPATVLTTPAMCQPQRAP